LPQVLVEHALHISTFIFKRILHGILSAGFCHCYGSNL